MRISRRVKRTLLALGALALGIQLIPVSRTNPPVVKELVWDSPATRALVRRACYDCHSNEVQWPWYAQVAPASWIIAHDVNSARERFNFSEISGEDRVGVLVKRIHNGRMPPKDYLALHSAARLSEQEKSECIAGLRRSFALSGLEPDPDPK
ncbi:MAG: heme-binding domain-containing protein [Verrucomicrobiota bacterium]